MTRFLALLTWLGFASASARALSTSDAFLDRTLPASLLPPYDDPPVGIEASRIPDFHSYGALAKAIEAASPKPVMFPPRWIAFVSAHEKETDWNSGHDFFLHGDVIASIFPPTTIRAYLHNLFGRAGLTWKYDPQRDAIVADFPWRTDDSRSGRDLLKFVVATKPTPVGGFHARLDPWTQAFNALLNKPGNYSRSWQLRFCADDRTFVSAGRIRKLAAGPIRDSAGTEHVLLVNDQPEFANPGPPGSFSYYLFTHDGRFEGGGVFTIGYRCFDDAAWLESNHARLHVCTYFNGIQSQESVFELNHDRLERTDILINDWPAASREIDTFQLGGTLFTAGTT